MRSGRSSRIQFSRLATVLGLLALSLSLGCQRHSDTDKRTVLVFAAASLSDALSEVGQAFRRESGIDITFNFAGSQTLAQQIAASGRGDVFISADEQWMDFVESKERLESETRVALLSNRLAVLCSTGADFELMDIRELGSADFTFLCIGDPDAVPAGRYVRRWLESEKSDHGESVWNRVRGRVSPAPDVRSALAQALGRMDSIGIVYGTDFQRVGERARLLLESPDLGIRYPMALLSGRSDKEGGNAFYRFVQSEPALRIFEQHGFERVE